jgi:hypothetical protein
MAVGVHTLGEVQQRLAREQRARAEVEGRVQARPVSPSKGARPIGPSSSNISGN